MNKVIDRGKRSKTLREVKYSKKQTPNMSILQF